MNLPDLSTYVPNKDQLKGWGKQTLKYLGYLLILFIFFIAAVWFFFGRSLGTDPDDIVWGVTYSPLATEGFAMDSNEVYEAVINDLKPDKIRLVAYWNRIEKEPGVFDFSALDFQVDRAEEAGIPYIIAVGRRVPRYPECHAPEWVDKLALADQDQATLNFIDKTIDRYDGGEHLDIWQIENEPLLSFFGECPQPREEFLAQEINFARTLTEKRIMTTESGELSFWLRASAHPDILGTTLYRRVIISGTNIAANHIYPSWYYKSRSNIVKKVNGNLQDVVVAELQAEPWSNVPIIDADRDELNRTMNPNIFESNINFTANVGFPEAYLWGVEWWYYEKEVHNNDYYWESAKQLFGE